MYEMKPPYEVTSYVREHKTICVRPKRYTEGELHIKNSLALDTKTGRHILFIFRFSFFS